VEHVGRLVAELKQAEDGELRGASRSRDRARGGAGRVGRQEHALGLDLGEVGDVFGDLLGRKRRRLNGERRELGGVVVADALELGLLSDERPGRPRAESFEAGVEGEFPAGLLRAEQRDRWVVGRQLDVLTRRPCDLAHAGAEIREPSGLDLGEQQSRLDAARGVDSEIDDGGAVVQLVADDVELAGEVERLVDEPDRGPVDAFHARPFSLPQ